MYIVSLPSHQLNIQHSAPNLLNNVNMLNYVMLRRLAFHFIQPARVAHACKILTPSSPQPPSNFCSSIRSPGIYLFCTRLRDSGRYSRAQPSTNPAARHTHNGMLIISHVLLQLSVIRKPVHFAFSSLPSAFFSLDSMALVALRLRAFASAMAPESARSFMDVDRAFSNLDTGLMTA